MNYRLTAEAWRKPESGDRVECSQNIPKPVKAKIKTTTIVKDFMVYHDCLIIMRKERR